jgi:hypothetical protein
MGTWTNVDGLYIKYGPTEVKPTKGGEYMTGGVAGEHVIEFDLDYTMLGTAAAVVADNVVIPKNAFIDRVEVITTTAWDSASDNFVLNLGTVRLDRSTLGDENGLIAALPQASMDPAGEYQDIKIGHTYVGVQVGTVLANPMLVTADYDTGAPTAGKSKIRIIYDFRNV